MLWGMAVSVRSAIENSSAPVAVHVIGSGLKPADRAALEASWPSAQVSFHDIDYSRISDFRSTKYLKSKVAYARYYLAEFLPDVSRCVYLDTDLIVLRDLAEADGIDLQGHIVGAVRDISVRQGRGLDDLKERLGLSDPGSYFNSGFLIIDLDEWRRQSVQQQLVEVSTAMFDRLHSQDQDALNVVLEGRTKLLDVHWNTSQYEADAPFADGVLHLIGTVKPWHHDYAYKFKGLFFEHLDRTAFSGRRATSPRSPRAIAERLSRLLPTFDMVTGKIRRAAGPRSRI